MAVCFQSEFRGLVNINREDVFCRRTTREPMGGGGGSSTWDTRINILQLFYVEECV